MLDPNRTNRAAPAGVEIGIPIFLFLVSTMFLGSCLDPFTPIKSFLLKMMAIAGILSILKNALDNGYLKIVRTSLDWRIAALLAWFGAGGFYALNTPRWLEQWTLMVAGSSLFFIIVFCYRSATRIRALMFWMILPVIVIAPLCVSDLVGRGVFPWDHLIANRFFSVFSYLGVLGQPPPGWIHNFSGRVSGPFGNPVHLAAWLVLMMPVAWTMFKESKSPAARVFYLISVEVMGLLLIATFTRSSWICAAIGFFVLAVINIILKKKPGGRVNKPVTWGIIVIVLTIAAGGYFFALRGGLNPSRFNVAERIESLGNLKDPSLLERTLIWKTGIEMLNDNIIKGVGPGNFQVYHPWYQLKFFDDPFWVQHVSFPDRAHNVLIDVWAETGVIGIALFLLLITGLARAAMIGIGRGGEKGRLLAGVTAGGAGFLLYSMFQFPLHETPTASYAWIFAALIINLGSDTKETRLNFRKPAPYRETVLTGLTLAVLIVGAGAYLFRPVIADVAYNHGVTTTDPREINQAMALMDKGIESQPGNLEFYVRYSSLIMRLSDKIDNPDQKHEILGKVLDISQRAIAFHPFDSRTHLNAGVALMRLGEYDKAKDALERAKVLNPADPLPYHNLGLVYYILGLYNYSAINYNMAAEKDEDFPHIYENLGHAYLALGLKQEALDAFKVAIVKDGESKRILNSTGRVFSEMGKSEHAVSSYLRALELDPEFAEARGNLAIEYITMGRLTEAVRELEKVLETNPDSSIAHFQLGRAYYKMGRIEEAVGELKEAIRINPDARDAKELLEVVSGGN